jgi:hypothetical protein
MPIALEHDRNAIASADKKGDMSRTPDPPRKCAAKLPRAELGHRRHPMVAKLPKETAVQVVANEFAIARYQRVRRGRANRANTVTAPQPREYQTAT